MFLSLSKTIAKFGGFRLGFGLRLNKKNSIWISLLLVFVVMFQLMWYMMILCGWMMYAMCYGIYWCIKKLINASSQRSQESQSQNTSKDTIQNTQTKGNEENTTMTPETNTPSNINLENQSSKKKSTIARWIIGGCFAMFALVNGFHYSSLFLLCAAFLMFPLSFVASFMQKRNIKTIVAIILSITLFFAGVITSPPTESTDSPSGDTTQTTTNYTENTTKNPTLNNSGTTKPQNTTSNKNTSTSPDNTTSNDEKVVMVWIPSSGSKYHSKSTCSNMSSPRQIPLEDAKNQGYEACKKCH